MIYSRKRLRLRPPRGKIVYSRNWRLRDLKKNAINIFARSSKRKLTVVYSGRNDFHAHVIYAYFQYMAFVSVSTLMDLVNCLSLYVAGALDIPLFCDLSQPWSKSNKKTLRGGRWWKTTSSRLFVETSWGIFMAAQWGITISLWTGHCHPQCDSPTSSMASEKRWLHLCCSLWHMPRVWHTHLLYMYRCDRLIRRFFELCLAEFLHVAYAL